jgi:hypothetical protein
VLPLAALILPAPPVSAAEACPDAFFVGVRGSGNPLSKNQGVGPSVEAVLETTRATLRPDIGLELIALEYPAVSVEEGIVRSPFGAKYKESVSEGADLLEREVSTRLNTCSVTPLVVAGHSQGAQVIDRYMAEAGARAMPNVVGVALLGDPTRFPTNPYNVDPNPPGAGVFHSPFWGSFRKDTVVPPDYWGVVDSFCMPGDPICAGGPERDYDVGGDVRLLAMFRDSQHSAYASAGVSEQAGRILALRIEMAIDETRPPDGTFGPRIGNPSLHVSGIAATDTGSGYWLALDNGDVDDLGDAPVVGSLGGGPLNAPIVGMAARNSSGYWLVGADGGVFALGGAEFHGSLADTTLASPVVGLAAGPDGTGYWLACADGSVHAFGSAVLHGSASSLDLVAPIVGIGASVDGDGYWLAAADGGVFSFGDASFYGSVAEQDLNQPVVGIARTPGGAGYWLVASDGGIFSFGDAPFLGSGVDRGVTSAVTGIASNPDEPGYWISTSDGSVYGFGAAPMFDS